MFSLLLDWIYKQKGLTMNEPRRNQCPSDEEITICAYLIGEREGRHEGRDKVHWGQAEVQLPVFNAVDLLANGRQAH
jgi:hypothetical protein